MRRNDIYGARAHTHTRWLVRKRLDIWDQYFIACHSPTRDAGIAQTAAAAAAAAMTLPLTAHAFNIQHTRTLLCVCAR